MAIDLGASSPKTMCITVIKLKAIIGEAVLENEFTNSGDEPNEVNRLCNKCSITDSPTHPKPREASVIPNCVAARYPSKCCVIYLAMLETLLPDLA